MMGLFSGLEALFELSPDALISRATWTKALRNTPVLEQE